MEISLLKVLLNNISLYFRLSSHEDINQEPVRKYYQKIEEILKLLKPVLDAVLQADMTFEELPQKAFVELGLSVSDLRKLFENWQPLGSKINFVLQVESSMSKLRASGVEIFELLKSFDERLPVELNASSLEIFAQKIKQVGLEQTSALINRTMGEQVDGSGPSSESLEMFFDRLCLKSNQELLIEAVALEKLKENSEQAENNEEAEYFEQMIAVVTHMHEQLVTMKQLQSSNPVPIPADFCCPLSLELMTDPVIVASGQTYERAFIRKWIDLGLTVCPKTRQTLAHTNLIPNYTVKALIANWCDTNNVKLPDPTKSMCLNQPSSVAHMENNSRCNQPVSPESTRTTGSPRVNLIASCGTRLQRISPSHPRSSSEGALPSVSGNGHGLDIPRISRSGEMTNAIKQSLVSASQPPTLPQTTDHARASWDNGQSSEGHNRSASASSVLSNLNMSQEMLADGNEVSSNASGELTSESQSATTLTTTPQADTELPPRLETRTRSQPLWRRPSDRLVSRIVSSPTEIRPDLSGVEAEVRNLVEDLRSTSLDAQRNAAVHIRLLAKHNMDNRIVIASCGAIALLVDLLRSTDAMVQENAVTALLNLSINDNNKSAIAHAGAIEPLIHVLETGSPEAKENSAATLFSLSVIEDNKVRIGRSGAIGPLVDLLGNGTPRGKKDAATALFNLSIFHENKGRIVQAGAVRHLVELMDPAAGMVDKAVAVLANLATIQEGRTAIGQEGGIPVLVEVVELGSARGKENAAAALLHLCTNSNRFCSMVLQEGAVPPLVALSQSGTPRAKEKAQALLSYFRNQRHGNAGRG
ncbi:U-box domain-containing protein 4-like isoform X2 [Rhododendron vialii]|nr:U-box domain-containing protein 4-like isoform X2 [Rhododendron vialii]XP_058186355.1 U-box domain-containing protein 4-like isoform X2 [Rhododendron vialii]